MRLSTKPKNVANSAHAMRPFSHLQKFTLLNVIAHFTQQTNNNNLCKVGTKNDFYVPKYL